MSQGFFQTLHFFFIKKWYFDILYNRYIATVIYEYGLSLYTLGDQGLLEFVGPQGIFNQLSNVPSLRTLSVTEQYNLVLTSVAVLLFLFFGLF